MKHECSIANALGVVGDRWSLLVVRELVYGRHRFGQIADGTGAPTDVLTARLRKLTETGVIATRQYSERPPRSDYHLTDAGRELAPTLLLLLAWGDKWVSKTPPVTVVHGDDGDEHPVEPVVTCAACGARVEDGPMTAVTPGGHRMSLSAGIRSERGDHPQLA